MTRVEPYSSWSDYEMSEEMQGDLFWRDLARKVLDGGMQ
jgi:hypothetical protein